VPTQLARVQIASMRGKAKASLLLAIDDIRRRGCAAADVRLAGEQLSAVCRLDLYGAWRLLTTFEAPDRCILLLVAEHTRSANPYQLLYATPWSTAVAGVQDNAISCLPERIHVRQRWRGRLGGRSHGSLHPL
jgi:hypothetical protein